MSDEETAQPADDEHTAALRADIRAMLIRVAEDTEEQIRASTAPLIQAVAQQVEDARQADLRAQQVFEQAIQLVKDNATLSNRWEQIATVERMRAERAERRLRQRPAPTYKAVIERYNRAHGQNPKTTLKDICEREGVSYDAVRQFRSRTAKRERAHEAVTRGAGRRAPQRRKQ